MGKEKTEKSRALFYFLIFICFFAFLFRVFLFSEDSMFCVQDRFREAIILLRMFLPSADSNLGLSVQTPDRLG